MKYRKFGNTGWDVSALGFGMMRLPLLPGAASDKEIDEKEAARMVRHAIDKGVNYLDTAYVYHGGLSEAVLGRILKDGYRKKVKIADKLPVHLCKNPDDFDRIIDEQMKRLDTGHIDFYLFHGIGRSGWEDIQRLELIKKAETAKKDGRISHIGFSFHGDAEFIIDGYDKWEFCQIQYNYMDTENQAGTEGLEYAGSRGIPVIVMEPLLGGRLANPPKEVKKVFDAHKIKRKYADWALLWLWNRPETALVLSGMSEMRQVEENIKSASESCAGLLSAGELQLFDKAAEAYGKRKVIPCTACKYCMPCPHGVNIPLNFEMYNEGIIYDEFSAPQWRYRNQVKEEEKAYKCVSCGECAEKCPQNIEISGWLEKAHEALK